MDISGGLSQILDILPVIALPGVVAWSLLSAIVIIPFFILRGIYTGKYDGALMGLMRRNAGSLSVVLKEVFRLMPPDKTEEEMEEEMEAHREAMEENAAQQIITLKEVIKQSLIDSGDVIQGHVVQALHNIQVAQAEAMQEMQTQASDNPMAAALGGVDMDALDDDDIEGTIKQLGGMMVKHQLVGLINSQSGGGGNAVPASSGGKSLM